VSRENVVFFSQAINRIPELNKRVVAAERTVQAWVDVAHEAGFEFTAEEFASVVGETLGRNVTPDKAVSEYLAAQYDLGAIELSERALDQVVGGRIRNIVISNT
jgi:nitrogen fixation uncharacterized protein